MTWMKIDLFVTIRQQGANKLRPYIFVYLRKQDIYPYGRDVLEIEIQKHKDLQGPDAKSSHMVEKSGWRC
jgi:hypothetical protein